MSSMRDKLEELEREVKASRGPAEPIAVREKPSGHHKRPIRKSTKKKILVGAALALTALLIWKKMNIHFVVVTSFWGFLGIVAVVFALLYGVLYFFFDSSEDG